MQNEQEADYCFVALKYLLSKGVLTQEQHDELQTKVKLPDEMQAYGTCHSGQCDF